MSEDFQQSIELSLDEYD